MKPWKHIILVLILAITILSLLLAACGPLDDPGGKSNNGKGNDKENNKDKDKDNGNDKDKNADKITICHKTGSAKNPYVEIRVSKNAIKDGHGTHEGDLIPAPESGCPETVATDVPAK